MGSSKDPSKLDLEIVTEWQTYRWVMSPGDELICGRSPDCEVLIPRGSVSQEHLKIHWNGFELFVSDLGSANGTFEENGESRFVEATFRDAKFSKSLKVSKSPITISGQKLEATQVKTVFSKPDPGQPLAPDDPANNVTRTLAKPEWTTTESPQKTRVKKPKKEISKKPVHENTKRPKESPKIVVLKKLPNLSVESSQVFAGWFCVFTIGFIFLIGSLGLGWISLKGLLRLDSLVYVRGASHDLNLIWIEVVRNLKSQIFLFAFGEIIGTVFFIKNAKDGKIPLVQNLGEKFQNLPFFSIQIAQLFSISTWILVIAWLPVFASFTSGLQHSPFKPEYLKFWKIVKSKQIPFSDRSDQLKSLLPELRGSSLLYREILVTDRALVLADCEGKGNSDWEAKKMCLLLLAGKSIEIFDWVKPAALARPAARTALLTALDGVTRTLSVEGIEQNAFSFYYSALIDIGLEPEADEIKTLIQNNFISVEDKLKQLVSLRRSTEVALEKDQTALNLPSIFWFDVPGPLESGI